MGSQAAQPSFLSSCSATRECQSKWKRSILYLQVPPLAVAPVLGTGTVSEVVAMAGAAQQCKRVEALCQR